MKQLQQIKLILEQLESEKLLNSIDKIDFFYDEPKIFKYLAILAYPKIYSDGIAPEIINSNGYSFISKYEALGKCLGEAMERLAVYCFKKKDIIFSTRAKLKKEALPLSFYYDDPMTINYINFGWVKGTNITKNTSCLIPGQLIYLNFVATFREHQFCTLITTGAAGGYSHEKTLLTGIYEIVERDAFMTTYLNKIKLPLINLQSLNDSEINSIVESFRRYNLELYVFETTNDLAIPAFMAVIIDRTGLGPAVTVGLKANLNAEQAITGAIIESLSIRIWIRYEMYKLKKQSFSIDPAKIKTQKERGLYWAHQAMIKKLDYLLKTPRGWQSRAGSRGMTPPTVKRANPELLKVTKLLSQKGFEIFYKDISLPFYNKLGYRVYKVIIPALQPVYLDETHREIRKERLKTVAAFFCRKKYYINPIPQPFL